MSNKAKTWSLLARRVRTRASAALAEVLKASERRAELQKSSQRLNVLHADYLARLDALQDERHSMIENMNYRSYIAYVAELQARLALQLEAARETLMHAKQLHQALEAERNKMTQLAESALETERRRRSAAEQTKMDALAITRFNLS